MIERPVMFEKKQYFKNKEDFLVLFNRIESDSIAQDFNSVPCFAPKEGLQKLKDSKYFAGDILLLYGLKNNSTFQSYYYAGFNEFAEFLGLWGYGFRSLEAIDRIMNADKKRYFAQAVYSDGMFADYTDKEFRNDKIYEHTEEFYREKGNEAVHQAKVFQPKEIARIIVRFDTAMEYLNSKFKEAYISSK